MIAGFLSFLVVIIAIVLWIVFTPVIISMDTMERCLQVVQRGTFMMRWTLASSPEVRIFGIKKSIASPDLQGANKPTAGKESAINKSLGRWLFLIRGCFRSMSIRKLVMDLDTGDVVLNAKLVPALFFLSNQHVALSTNFGGRVYMHVEIEVRLNKVLWTWVLFLTKK